MRNRRPLTSFTLAGGAVLLLVAIIVGQRLGDSVLRQVTEQRSAAEGLLVTPVPVASNDGDQTARDWKRDQVVSVATDPAFPDPRATPQPTPEPTPQPAPTPAPPTAEPSIDDEVQPPAEATPAYTSPPLPIPLVSHPPQETQTDPPDTNGFPQGIPPASPDPRPAR